MLFLFTSNMEAAALLTSFYPMMRSTVGIFLLIAFGLLTDYYLWHVLKQISKNGPIIIRIIPLTLGSILSLFCFLTLVATVVEAGLILQKWFSRYFFSVVAGWTIAKTVAILFCMVDESRRVLFFVFGRLISKSVESSGGFAIPRSAFLSWLGLGLGSTIFGLLLYGFRNTYNYQVKKIQLRFDNLPTAFKGLKIVQISDIHSGSLSNHSQVKKGIEKIIALKADMVLFTGDLVNDRYEEVLPFMEIFNRISAPMGVFSVLGNHDYGDYFLWPSLAAKQENLRMLKIVHQKLGWNLLLNEHVMLEKDGQKIALLGVENYGAKGHFPKHGKLKDAYEGTENIPFKILMSHDPSHWDAEVIPKYKDIDLMLSGHTHGMQFGIENPYFRFSPVQWMYKQWAGLYEEGNQKLYVNRGFGCIGYPGRVGILPEITLFELI